MQSEPGHQRDRDEAGATSSRPEPDTAAADVNPEHDETTSREAFEREMAEQGRSEEAARHGDHIE